MRAGASLGQKFWQKGVTVLEAARQSAAVLADVSALMRWLIAVVLTPPTDKSVVQIRATAFERENGFDIVRGK